MIPEEHHIKIPHGLYCYGPEGNCPFWFRNEYGLGDCRALILFDGKRHNGEEEELDLELDDQCKSCGVNDDLLDETF